MWRTTDADIIDVDRCVFENIQEITGEIEKRMSDYPPSQYPEQSPATQPGYPQTQPGYPQPGGFSQLPDPIPPKRRSMLWIVLPVLLLIVAGVGVYYYVQVRPSPQKTLQAYCTALQNNDAPGIYNTLSEGEQSQTTVNTIQASLRFFDLIAGGVQSCVVNDTQDNGSTATGSITLVSTRNHSGISTLHLVYENGQWKIDNKAGLP